MAAQTEALLQQMQEQIAQLQLELAASSAASLAATNAAAAATTALAGLPLTGNPNLGLWSFLGLGYLHWGQTVPTRL
jgi:hypothetical protein